MTSDILLTSELATEWNERGDIAVVDGVDRIEQGVIITIQESVELQAPEPTPEAIESQRASVEQAVIACDVTQPPIAVTVEESPLDSTETADDTLSVTYGVQTNRIDISVSAT